MARPLRIEFPGAVYHVTSRGNARADVFEDDTDCEMHLKILEQVVKRFNWLCHAYFLMDNHYHLLIETPEGNPRSQTMNKQGTITFLEKVRIQARVLVPLIKAFEAELGSARARSIAREALQNSVRKSYAKLREKYPGNPIELIPGGIAMFAEDALEYEVIVHTSEAFDFNVTKCAYAEFYKAMGEPELGFLFVCDQDHAIAEGLGSDLEFKRTQTIMQGATHCDFRFRCITIGCDPNNDSL